MRVAWAVAVAVLVAPVSAHRLDEYLQAARIGIDPDRVRVELDLTPGVSVAPRVLAEIDRDGDSALSREEVSAYAARVAGEIRLDVDGHPLALEPVESQCHLTGQVLKGEGTLALQWTAALPALPPGTHHMTWRNGHHSDIGVYLANALVPASARVAVTAQRRDVDQRELNIDYELGDAAQTNARWWLASAGAVVLVVAAAWRGALGTVPRDP